MSCDFCCEKEYRGQIGYYGSWDAHRRRTYPQDRISVYIAGSFYEMQLTINCCRDCWRIASQWHLNFSIYFSGMEHIASCIRKRMSNKTIVTLPDGSEKTVCTHKPLQRGMEIVIPRLYPKGYTPSVNGELREKKFIYLSEKELISKEEWMEMNAKKIQAWWRKAPKRVWRPRRAALVNFN